MTCFLFVWFLIRHFEILSGGFVINDLGNHYEGWHGGAVVSTAASEQKDRRSDTNLPMNEMNGWYPSQVSA